MSFSLQGYNPTTILRTAITDFRQDTARASDGCPSTSKRSPTLLRLPVPPLSPNHPSHIRSIPIIVLLDPKSTFNIRWLWLAFSNSHPESQFPIPYLAMLSPPKFQLCYPDVYVLNVSLDNAVPPYPYHVNLLLFCLCSS